jgi:DNA polymerase-3 subunit epsilon
MLSNLRRRWWRRRLRDPAYAFLAEPDPHGELVSLDCETTSLDPRSAELLSIAAIRIRGDRILTSQALDLLVRPAARPSDAGVLIHKLRTLDVAGGLAPAAALERLLRFVGGRTLLGYYLEFDLGIINRYLRPELGVPLPNPRVEVSALYYDLKTRRLPGSHVDLSLQAIRADLDLPDLPEHDAFNDALMAAMIYLRLKGRAGRADLGSDLPSAESRSESR